MEMNRDCEEVLPAPVWIVFQLCYVFTVVVVVPELRNIEFRHGGNHV